MDTPVRACSENARGSRAAVLAFALFLSSVPVAALRAAETPWRIQFTDDFNRETLYDGEIDLRPPDWRILSGKWRLEDNMLSGDTDASIALLLRFPGDQRVEFDAIARDNVCDLSAVLCTSEKGGANSGYFFGFGSNHNEVSRILVEGREVKRYDARIVPGKLHRIVCQREGSQLTHTIDGQVVATWEDPQPLSGAGHEAVGFYIFGAGRIDNVKVYTKAGGTPRRYATPRAEGSHAPRKPGSLPVKDPLFAELFGDTPGPTRFFSYGGKYDPRPGLRQGALDLRETARRFGARFVIAEQLDEAAKYRLIVYGNMDHPEYAKRGIATQSVWVEAPTGSYPRISNGQGWVLDPRYLDHLVTEIENRARGRRQWGIPMFDELWTYYVIKPVPADQWYPQVDEADREIREKYGFGKYGMPKSHESGDPFSRLAHRRWASDRLTQTWARAYRAAKALNPDMMIIGPTEGSSGTSADVEAWSPYFDIMGGQCGLGCTSAYFDSVRVGAVTKTYADLTDTPIWMMVHTCVRHAPRRTPEDIREMYSQVFRNGGRGLWLMHAEFYEAELEDAFFAEPAKWRAMLQLTETLRNMRLPKLPDPDCAILWSSDSTYTTTWGGLDGNNDRVISAYTLLGPMLRSWFQFVDDRQIERGTRDLARYKVVYVPFSTYQRASVVEKLGAYVRGGGTLVCTDIDAFTWNIDGEPHGERWEQLSGVRRVSKRDEIATFTAAARGPLGLAKPLTMTSLAPGWNLAPLDSDVRVVAVYADSSPAITLHPVGRGRVIVFAADPLEASDFYPVREPYFSLSHALDKDSLVTPDAPIVAFIKAVQKSVGAQLGRDIWRFKLPPFAVDPYQKEQGVCLTGNYVFDVNEPLLEPNNLQTGGSYTYSRAPEGVPDVVGQGGALSFREGKLTNRLKAYETRQRFESRNRNFESITPQWVVSWTDPAPVDVTFDLQGDHPLARVRLFHSGTLPALTVNASRDGATWDEIAAAAEQQAGLDVMDLTAPLRGSYRHVRLSFAKRQSGERFELSEVEIWGHSEKDARASRANRRREA